MQRQIVNTAEKEYINKIKEQIEAIEMAAKEDTDHIKQLKT